MRPCGTSTHQAASSESPIGEDHDPETHLIPLVLQVALGQRDKILIFGDDYPTPDGTCVRDYIHVDDLATAHLAALERLEKGSQIKLNLGTGQGASVKEVIEASRRVTGHAIPAETVARREGDPPELVADARLANKTLDWQPKYADIESVVASAWKWHQGPPEGVRRSGLGLANNSSCNLRTDSGRIAKQAISLACP